MRGHSLRAGAATEALDRGVPLEDVMALTRHKNPATTLHYDRYREQRSARVDLDADASCPSRCTSHPMT
ncbi:hypothetical protein [Nocardia xishanensis]|uniref:Tyr recombinase domain-containing protein n=1 Tax=Nocardia xishanensis TaxID=238964 RepID=A0ABW7X7A2_9NOCA